MLELKELLERQTAAMGLARRAAQIIRETSGQIKTVDQKCSFADLVTESDRAVERFLFDELRRLYPEDRFIGEESASTAKWTAAPTWVIDPIDGTTNFVHTFPFSCISIGLTVDREPCIGIVYNAIQDHMYTAVKGQGARLLKNGGADMSEVHVRACPGIEQALVLAELGSQRDAEKKACVFQNLESVGWNCHGIRMLGSAALSICSVASGYADGYYEFGPYIWDICAGVVILTEAGGYVCDTSGGPLDMQARRFVAASSESLAKQIAARLVVQISF